ncbi:unnamed protein product [Adineta ricciae]|uniref:Uncharacterized protein n=1 Tax=Adineta ricciae TaxID=249248 RepID=A0A815PH82_ADIRI|nr:unnamed protein product [Adineta ricciae]
MSTRKIVTTVEKADTWQPIDVEMMQSVVVTWLDNHIDSNSEDRRYTIKQLQRLVDTVEIFSDNDECVEFILNSGQDKVYLIISGSLGRSLVPCIHDIPQLDCLFIFCENKLRHEQWTNDWIKIKGVFIDAVSLCKAIEDTFRRYEQNAMPMSFIASGRRPDQLDPLFMYTQLFKEILLSIDFDDKHIKDFIKHYPGLLTIDDKQSPDIDQLVRDYRTKEPVWWYTKDTVLHSMLNRALRILDPDILVPMGFFITDLHRSIEKLHKEQFLDTYYSTTFMVYRGQGLSKADFAQLRQAKGGLVSFNSFLSTTTDRGVSLAYAESSAYNPDLLGILFNIKINPSESTTPFALIEKISYFSHEAEVLFSMHSVFHIHDIKSIGTDRPIYEVDLSLTSASDKELTVLADHFRPTGFLSVNSWFDLGNLLIQLHHTDKAEEICYSLLSNASEDEDLGDLYHHLGIILHQKGEFSEAIKYYDRSVAIQENLQPFDRSSLATSYNSIGRVYHDTGDYAKALEYYEKGLSIEQQSLPANPPDFATSYNNIGSLYDHMGDHAKALRYYEKGFSIIQQSLPAIHPDLAASYNNIGLVYAHMGDYAKALQYYEKGLSIIQQSLPADHPSLATSYNNIGGVYDAMGDYAKALQYYEKGLSIKQQSLPANHPDLATSYNNISGVYDHMGDYAEALQYYEKGLSIDQQSLPANHPSLATSYNNIGLVYDHMGDYAKALQCYEKDLSIIQQSLPANHPDLATSYNNIGGVYDHMGDYAKALRYYEKGLSIIQQSLPADHPSLATSYNNIGLVYDHMGDYAKALQYYEKGLSIDQQSLPANHPSLATSYNNIGLVYYHMDDYAKAYLFLQRSMEICKQSLPATHSQLRVQQKSLERVKEALLIYQLTLED